MTRLIRLAVIGALVTGALTIAAQPAFAPCHMISWVGDPYSVGETAGTVAIHVTNGGNGGPETVDYATVDGTAKAGMDYTATHGTLVWPSNAGAEQTFSVPIRDDAKQESNQGFTVHLSHPTGCSGFTVQLPDHDARVTIVEDNDAAAHPTPSHSTTPKPTTTSTPKGTPTPKSSATQNPTPSGTSPTTGSSTPSASPQAAANTGGSGLSGGALAGIVIGVIVVGGAAALFVRRRFLT